MRDDEIQRLIEYACRRFRRLASKMLDGYPALRRWEETDDVLQNALIRLCRALETVEIESDAHFHHLAALQLRRELLDMCRRYLGPEGLAANHADPAGEQIIDQAAAPGEPKSFEEWTLFHEAAASLPHDEREVFQLKWYEGLGFDEIANILGVCTKTAQRRWASALCLIGQTIRGPRLD